MSSEFKPGSIVWAKCGSLFWPAEVVDFNKLPEDIQDDFPEGKKPQYVVKFFDEDGYEFLKNDKNLFPYNCAKKEEFIKKGIVKSRTKSKEGATSGWFAKFPEDVIRCEKLTGGDVKLLEKDPYVERNDRVNYKEIFGDPNEKPKTGNKRKGNSSPAASASPKKKAKEAKTPSRPISHPRFKPGGEQHQVRIMQQPSTPYHLDLQKKEENKAAAAQGNYNCQVCGFSTSRLNVLILHNKSHSEPAKAQSAKSTKSAKPASPATPTTSRGRKRGGSAASTPARSRASSASATEKKTPAKAANGRGGGRGGRASAASKAKASPVESPAKEKKPRLSKKKKDQLAKEQEKKIEERKKILGEWDEEEDGDAEVEEKKKLKQNVEDSDVSEAESDQEAYFQDDNIQGNTYMDEDDEEYFEEKKEEKEEEKKEEEEEKEEKKEPEVETEKEEETNQALECVAKVLEETKVPELPDLGGIKKSVKFSPQVAKEISITKFALVQPKSNMAGPMEVEDEFAEAAEDIVAKSSTAKTILKRRSRSPPPPKAIVQDDEELEDDEPSTSEAPQEVSSTENLEENDSAKTLNDMEETSNNIEMPSKETEEVSSTETKVTSSNEEDKSTSEAAETMLVLGQQSTTAVSSDEVQKDSGSNPDATYLLVMDESNQLDQLNSQQTFYIDSNSLANGDLSNMVLATEQPNGHHDTTNGNGGQEQQPAVNASEAVQTSSA